MTHKYSMYILWPPQVAPMINVGLRNTFFFSFGRRNGDFDARSAARKGFSPFFSPRMRSKESTDMFFSRSECVNEERTSLLEPYFVLFYLMFSEKELKWLCWCCVSSFYSFFKSRKLDICTYSKGNHLWRKDGKICERRKKSFFSRLGKKSTIQNIIATDSSFSVVCWGKPEQNKNQGNNKREESGCCW